MKYFLFALYYLVKLRFDYTLVILTKSKLSVGDTGECILVISNDVFQISSMQ